MSIDFNKVTSIWYDAREMVVGYKNKRWYEESIKELPDGVTFVERVEVYHNVYNFYMDDLGQGYVIITWNES